MGKEFLSVFEDWADTYDETVSNDDNEYQDYFKNYDEILNMVTDKSYGTVLEFGVGTGNLTEKLLNKGLEVIGIDPSDAMRTKAKEKLPNLNIIDGDFDRYPKFDKPINSIVSTYAFHHLTDKDKGISIAKFSDTLSKGGKVIFADVIFENSDAYKEAINEAINNNFLNVSRDLQEEYYSTIEELENLFSLNNFEVSFVKCNRYVWLLEARKN